jgi:hypothetical protein
MNDPEHRIKELRERLARAVADAPDLAEVLRGSVGERYVHCGKAGCRCQDGPGHGPIYYVSISLGSGRTEQVTVAKDDYDLACRYAENYARLRAILEEVSSINREILRELRKLRRKRRHDKDA